MNWFKHCVQALLKLVIRYLANNKLQHADKSGRGHVILGLAKLKEP